MIPHFKILKWHAFVSCIRKSGTMTLEQFKYLNEDDQQFVLQRRAVYIATLENSQCKKELFQLDSFYIEIEYQTTFMQVLTVNLFEDPSILEPYLECIDIDEIYEYLDGHH